MTPRELTPGTAARLPHTRSGAFILRNECDSEHSRELTGKERLPSAPAV